MESLQIRFPKKIVEQMDKLVKSGIFRSRSEILRESIPKFMKSSNYNGSAPFIVGRFKNRGYLKEFDPPISDFELDPETVES